MKKDIYLRHMVASLYYADLSSCNRLKVGCVIVRDDRPISMGYNGPPKGWDNTCEDKEYKTFPYVYHAESNAISKLAKSTETSKGSTLFVTAEPCYDCSKLIAQCGIVKVFFYEEKEDRSGKEFLLRAGVKVFRFLDDPLLLMKNDDSRDFYTEITPEYLNKKNV